MSQPYDYEAIWLKAKSFVSRSFDALDSDAELAMLFAAVAFELLAKSALCRISPLLVASADQKGESLLLAAGLSGDNTRYRSISAHEAFSRCAKAFPKFDAKIAGWIASKRNAELHSGARPYDEIADHEIWWERFWSAAEVLTIHQHRTLEDLVGPMRLTQVQLHLDRNAKNVQRRVENLLAAARQRLDLGEAAQRLHLNYDFSLEIECPVCDDLGEMYGNEIAESEEFDMDDDLWPIEEIRVWADAFVCGTCGLVFEGNSYLTAAGLDDSFYQQRHMEVFDDWYYFR